MNSIKNIHQKTKKIKKKTKKFKKKTNNKNINMSNINCSNFDSYDLDPIQSNQFEDEYPIHPRIKYLRKLYVLMACQFLLIMLTTILFYKNETFSNVFISLIALILAAILMVLIFLFKRFFVRKPFNVLSFIFFSLFMTIGLSSLTIYEKTNVSLMLGTSTFFILSSLTVFVFNCKTEMNFYGVSVYIFGATFFVLQIFIMFSQINFDHLCFLFVTCLFLSFLFVFQTQTILDGGKLDFNEEDAWTSAVVIYLEIVIMLMKQCELLKQLIFREA